VVIELSAALQLVRDDPDLVRGKPFHLIEPPRKLRRPQLDRIEQPEGVITMLRRVAKSLPWGQRLGWAHRLWRRQGLVGQQAFQRLIAVRGLETESVPPYSCC
jgi:hypothetical protein